MLSPAGEAPVGPAPERLRPGRLRPRAGSSPALPLPLWRVRARRKAGCAGESHFQTAGSVLNWAGRRRMEAGLSAITVYLASTGSPVAATTMDRESVSRAEGEAVSGPGASAAAAFRESERQVGEAAAARLRPGEPSLPSALAPAALVAGRPSSETAARRRCVSGSLLSIAASAQRKGPLSTPALAAPRTLRRPQVSTGSSSRGSASERRTAYSQKVAFVAGGQATPASVASQPLLCGRLTWPLALPSPIVNKCQVRTGFFTPSL